jgi:hypothetical protein
MTEPKLITDEQLQNIIGDIKKFITDLFAQVPKAIYGFFLKMAGGMVHIAELVIQEAEQLKEALAACASARNHLRLTASPKSVAKARSDFAETVRQITNAADQANQLAKAHKMNLPPIPSHSVNEKLVEILGFFLDKAIDALPTGHLEFATLLHKDLKVMANTAQGENPIRLGSPGITVSLSVLKYYSIAFGYVKDWCPRDLSITASVVGEGGGTELCGHPAKQVPGTCKFVIDCIILILETVEKSEKNT